MTLTDSRPQITEPAAPVTVIDPLSAYCVPRAGTNPKNTNAAEFAQTPISVRMPTVGISPARQQTGCAKRDQPPATSYDDSDQSGGTGG